MAVTLRGVTGVVTALVCATLLSACGTTLAPIDQSSKAIFDRATATAVRHVTLAGKLDLSAYGLADETYAMHARRDAAGDVRGEIEIHLSDPLIDLHGDVTCLQVDGSLAWVGVQVTRSDAKEGPFAVGGSFWFRVQDNGEGSTAMADRISFLNPAGGAARCNEKRTGLQLSFEMQGNVQIR